jgi:hypothetical protein
MIVDGLVVRSQLIGEAGERIGMLGHTSLRLQGDPDVADGTAGDVRKGGQDALLLVIQAHVPLDRQVPEGEGAPTHAVAGRGDDEIDLLRRLSAKGNLGDESHAALFGLPLGGWGCAGGDRTR